MERDRVGQDRIAYVRIAKERKVKIKKERGVCEHVKGIKKISECMTDVLQ